MTTIRKATWAARTYSPSTFKAFLDTFDCPIISTSITSYTLNINVNNIVTVALNMDNNRTQVIYNGTTSNYSMINSYNPAQMTAICGDTFFYLQFNCDYGAGRRFCFVYEIISGKNYFGAVGAGTESSSAHVWYSITDITLKQVENSLNYTHKKVLSYAAPLNYIDYSSDILFESGTYASDVIDSNILTCSDVPQDNVITFNGNNYYSLGPNTLIQLNN